MAPAKKASDEVRVRFAPSPTGMFHIGSARTALFNWLYARHTGGKFVLRLEDTDAARNTPEAQALIYSSLEWLGVDWDEGPTPDGGEIGDCGPYRQSQRTDIHLGYVEKLLASGHAYKEDDGAIRFKLPNGDVEITDEICGTISFDLTTQPDITIVRKDGAPAFHLVNVVDDIEMGITHVIRGEDHLSNTPKHVAIYEALGIAPPKFAHIPLILNRDGSKMSKRQMETAAAGEEMPEGKANPSVDSYRKDGYMPQAFVNYLCLLGWSPKDNREVIDIKEVIELFELTNINRSNARFDIDKLFWINGEYFSKAPIDEIRPLAVRILTEANVLPEKYDEAYFDAALATAQEKIKLAGELPEWMDFYFRDDFPYEEKAAKKNFNEAGLENLKVLRDALAKLDAKSFTAEKIEAAFKAEAESSGRKIGAFVHPARLAASGKPVGPSLYHLLEVLGPERVLDRFDRALKEVG